VLKTNNPGIKKGNGQPVRATRQAIQGGGHLPPPPNDSQGVQELVIDSRKMMKQNNSKVGEEDSLRQEYNDSNSS
jgi:hypothetical protein